MKNFSDNIEVAALLLVLVAILSSHSAHALLYLTQKFVSTLNHLPLYSSPQVCVALSHSNQIGTVRSTTNETKAGVALEQVTYGNNMVINSRPLGIHNNGRRYRPSARLENNQKWFVKYIFSHSHNGNNMPAHPLYLRLRHHRLIHLYRLSLSLCRLRNGQLPRQWPLVTILMWQWTHLQSWSCNLMPALFASHLSFHIVAAVTVTATFVKPPCCNLFKLGVTVL